MMHYTAVHYARDGKMIRAEYWILDDALPSAAMRWNPEPVTGMAISYGSDR
jgi:hypothetical protein